MEIRGLPTAAGWVAIALLPSLAQGQAPATLPAASQPALRVPDGSGSVALAEKLVAQLGDDDYRVREQASLQLNSLDVASLPTLEAAFRRPELDAEQQSRLSTALNVLRPRAALLRARQLRSEWVGKTLHDAYVHGGHTKPAYDAAVHRAIDLYRGLGLDALRGPPAPREQALAAFREATDLGCDDPMVWCLYCIAYGKMNDSPVPNTPSTVRRVHDLEALAYSPGVKLLVMVRYFWLDGWMEPADLPVALKAVRELAKSPDVPPGELYTLCGNLHRGARRMGWVWGDSLSIANTYLEACPDDPDAMTLKAGVMLDEAVNGDGTATSLAAAEKLCAKAAELDPSDPRPPTLMLTILMHRGAPLDEIDTWFDKAMHADPDNVDVCTRKLEYLARQADAASELMIQFGRRCLAGRNWRAGIPLVLVRAHERCADASPDRKQYLSRPEVWEDIRAVYEGGLLSFPANVHLRSEYVTLAATCDHWDVVRTQTEQLGDHPDPSVFPSLTSYNYLRRKAARLTSPAATPATVP